MMDPWSINSRARIQLIVSNIQFSSYRNQRETRAQTTTRIYIFHLELFRHDNIEHSIHGSQIFRLIQRRRADERRRDVDHAITRLYYCKASVDFDITA